MQVPELLTFTAPGFHASVQLARAEGIVPAPKAHHAVKGAIEEALSGLPTVGA